MIKEISYCSRCVYPQIAVNLDLDDEGVCSSCRVFEEADRITANQWKLRENKFLEICDEMKKVTEGDYDCIVPVGGGKDSWYQVHKMKSLGLKPLMVTYYGNNYLPEGQRNLDRMKEELGADHYIFYPNVDVLKKLNKLCFKKMGDMNWHAHAGILIVPMVASMLFRVPLVVWGEIAWDISGMFSPDDYTEYNKRTVLEHDMRGYTLEDMVGQEGLVKEDLSWLRMPSDEEFQRHKTKGIYLGNFFNWDPHVQTKLLIDTYGWEGARQPFQRTYRMMSNLDDMHENGVHDYMKFIKFGYGRCSDHVSKDIRTGYMTREEGIELVRRYDDVKPTKDLRRWLEYVDMTEHEFDRIADTFRDSRVWSKNHQGEWQKDNIWNHETRQKKGVA